MAGGGSGSGHRRERLEGRAGVVGLYPLAGGPRPLHPGEHLGVAVEEGFPARDLPGLPHQRVGEQPLYPLWSEGRFELRLTLLRVEPRPPEVPPRQRFELPDQGLQPVLLERQEEEQIVLKERRRPASQRELRKRDRVVEVRGVRVRLDVARHERKPGGVHDFRPFAHDRLALPDVGDALAGEDDIRRRELASVDVQDAATPDEAARRRPEAGHLYQPRQLLLARRPQRRPPLRPPGGTSGRVHAAGVRYR